MSFSSDSMSSPARWLVLGVAVAVGVGCAPQEAPEKNRTQVATRGDSLAMVAYEATGGDAWESVRFLRFDFAVERDGARGRTIRHLWDRQSGDYRIEWPTAGDTTAVVLFNVGTREGRGYLNGAEVGGDARDALLSTAYTRFINDTYWLMAPAKVFDPGVMRTYVADSSSADVEVLHLAFDGVGLTPGDQYWLRVDPTSGFVTHWTYQLQGSENRSTYAWINYKSFDLPTGSVRLAERKEAAGAARAILTDRVSLPEAVPPGVFEEPAVAMR